MYLVPLEDLIGKARAAAGPNDARLMVGIEVEPIRVFNK